MRNTNMNDKVIQAMQRVQPYLRKAIRARQSTVRVSTDHLQYIFDAMGKAKSFEHFKADSRRFQALYEEAGRNMDGQESFQKLTPEQQEQFKLGMVTQGKIMDYFIATSKEESIDLTLMRTAIAQAVGCYLFLLHEGDIGKVTEDAKQMCRVMVAGANEFKNTVVGWESLINKGANNDGSEGTINDKEGA